MQKVILTKRQFKMDKDVKSVNRILKTVRQETGAAMIYTAKALVRLVKKAREEGRFEGYTECQEEHGEGPSQ